MNEMEFWRASREGDEHEVREDDEAPSSPTRTAQLRAETAVYEAPGSREARLDRAAQSRIRMRREAERDRVAQLLRRTSRAGQTDRTATTIGEPNHTPNDTPVDRPNDGPQAGTHDNVIRPRPILERSGYDLPKSVRDRYVAFEGKYLDRQSETVHFEDRGRSLATAREDREVIGHMVAVAQAKHWGELQLRGSEAFRRQAWIAAELAGIPSYGHRPDAQDRALLQAAREAMRIAPGDPSSRHDPSPGNTMGAGGVSGASPALAGMGGRDGVDLAPAPGATGRPATGGGNGRSGGGGRAGGTEGGHGAAGAEGGDGGRREQASSGGHGKGGDRAGQHPDASGQGLAPAPVRRTSSAPASVAANGAQLTRDHYGGPARHADGDKAPGDETPVQEASRPRPAAPGQTSRASRREQRKAAGETSRADAGGSPAVTEGRLLEHGHAPFNHDSRQGASYFATVRTPGGDRTVWGLDLERAISASGVQPGQRIGLEREGSRKVTLTRQPGAGNDHARTPEAIPSRRNAWRAYPADGAVSATQERPPPVDSTWYDMDERRRINEARERFLHGEWEYTPVQQGRLEAARERIREQAARSVLEDEIRGLPPAQQARLREQFDRAVVHARAENRPLAVPVPRVSEATIEAVREQIVRERGALATGRPGGDVGADGMAEPMHDAKHDAAGGRECWNGGDAQVDGVSRDPPTFERDA